MNTIRSSQEHVLASLPISDLFLINPVGDGRCYWLFLSAYLTLSGWKALKRMLLLSKTGTVCNNLTRVTTSPSRRREARRRPGTCFFSPNPTGHRLGPAHLRWPWAPPSPEGAPWGRVRLRNAASGRSEDARRGGREGSEAKLFSASRRPGRSEGVEALSSLPPPSKVNFTAPPAGSSGGAGRRQGLSASSGVGPGRHGRDGSGAGRRAVRAAGGAARPRRPLLWGGVLLQGRARRREGSGRLPGASAGGARGGGAGSCCPGRVPAGSCPPLGRRRAGRGWPLRCTLALLGGQPWMICHTMQRGHVRCRKENVN